MKHNKNLGLEGLRGLACMAVMIGHFSYVFHPYLASLFRPVPFSIKPSAFERLVSIPPLTLAYSADAAVSIFFVMSGCVLTTKFFMAKEIPALQSAAAKRYIRLGLPSFASIFLAWILWRSGAIYTAHANEIGVAGWVSGWYAGPFMFIDVFIDGLAGAPLFARTALNPALWTIQVELIGSIVLFAIISLFGKRPILLIDLPPTNRASRSLVKFVFGEEDEHEEALYGTANHRVSEGSRSSFRCTACSGFRL